MVTNPLEVEVLESPDKISKDYFLQYVYPKRKPVILRGIDIGEAPLKWNCQYLSSIVGNEPVKIHVCHSPQMDFLRKNFLYKTISFNEFLVRTEKKYQDNFFIDREEKYYLRSLGSDVRKDVADIQKQFPALADDLHIPSYFESDQFFSSVFRISSEGMQLWTHYDVMDNFLIHIKGSKRVVLFHPDQALNLYLSGDKSQVVDIDNPDLDTFPNFANAVRYECLLQPGDVLFIPALWFHNVIALDFCISVNVFWRHLAKEMYDIRDVYGNKDPTPVTRAMQGLEKAMKTLEELPDEYRDFYSRRLIAKIEQKLDSYKEKKKNDVESAKHLLENGRT